MAYCMLIIRNNRCHHPSPWFRCKSFIGCLRWCLFTQHNIHPVVIDDGEGHEEALEMEEVKRKRMEKDKENRLLQAQIANIRKKMQQLLGGFADYSIGTSEGVRGINPLNRLLPVQLLLRDILYYVRSVKVLLSCNDSQILLFVTLSHIVLGLILLFVPWAYLLHWIFRIIIWVFLGPWMKALDILYQRRGSKQMEVVMEEIRQREQNIWIKARTKQEEGVKLKSMRIVRFGPYSFKVPTLNITRHYDYPLPESTAMPAEKYIVDTSELNIQKSIPGQIHVGVMIPRLHSHERNTLSRPNMEGTARKLQGIRKIEDMQFDTEGINSCSTGQDEGFELIAHNGVKGITGSFGVNVCATGIS